MHNLTRNFKERLHELKTFHATFTNTDAKKNDDLDLDFRIPGTIFFFNIFIPLFKRTKSRVNAF